MSMWETRAGLARGNDIALTTVSAAVALRLTTSARRAGVC